MKVSVRVLEGEEEVSFSEWEGETAVTEGAAFIEQTASQTPTADALRYFRAFWQADDGGEVRSGIYGLYVGSGCRTDVDLPKLRARMMGEDSGEVLA